MDDAQLAVTDADPGRESRRKKQWSDLSPQQQRAIILGAIAELIMTTIAVRDLNRRPADQVRGWKVAWMLGFTVQPVGPLLYLLVGRRPPG
jgi:hypothetical protein